MPTISVYFRMQFCKHNARIYVTIYVHMYSNTHVHKCTQMYACTYLPVCYAVTTKRFNELQCSRCAPQLLKVTQTHEHAHT